MAASTGTRCRIATALAAVICAACPAPGWTWGWETHHYVARNYSQHLPAYMDGLRAYDGVVDALVTDADARKSYTPGEAERHYIDIDFYPEFFAGTLPHDRATLEARYGAATVLDVGVLPWAVGEVTATLTAQFQAGQWSAAAVTIADLCHYVGDASQPLHCTLNYNGQLTGNFGIHSRYETSMMSIYLGALSTAPAGVVHYPNAVDAIFDIITASWTGVSTVIRADDDAKLASGGAYDGTYYASLWAGTEGLTRERVDVATVGTASFVYAAWVNAGRPPVPGSSAEVPPAPGAIGLAVGPSPFRDVLTVHFTGAGPLDLDVFDVRGALVGRLRGGATGPGLVSWRPANAVGAGVYFIRLAAPDQRIVRRVTRVP